MRRAGLPAGNTGVGRRGLSPLSVTAALARFDPATVGLLLGRFVQSRDADAFAALVRRLGPYYKYGYNVVKGVDLVVSVDV